MAPHSGILVGKILWIQRSLAGYMGWPCRSPLGSHHGVAKSRAQHLQWTRSPVGAVERLERHFVGRIDSSPQWVGCGSEMQGRMKHDSWVVA